MAIEVCSALQPLATPLAVANGGTGATDAVGARDNLGLGSAALAGGASFQCGRLTLTSGVPATGADVTGASTIYFTPHLGTFLGIFDGTAFIPRAFAEISRSLSGLTSGKNYDVFAWWNGSNVVIDLAPAWTNDTTRATAVSLLSGVYVNDASFTPVMAGGTVAQYYGVLLGTIRTTGTSTTEDSTAKRFVSNARNAELKHLIRPASGGSHSYNTNSYRIWANDAANRFEWIQSLPRFSGAAWVIGSFQLPGSGSGLGLGLAIDSTSAADAAIEKFAADTLGAATILRIRSGIGYHYAAIVERGAGATTNFYYAHAEGEVWV